jgi:hypothetical protein
MDRYRQNWPDPGRQADDAESGGIEFLEDRTRPIAARHAGSRFGVSLPGAIAGAFLITAIAFGAALRPAGPTSSQGSNGQPAAAADAGTTTDGDAFAHADGKTGIGSDRNPGADADPAVDEPMDEPGDEPKPKIDTTTTDPTKAPEPTKAPTPAPLPLSFGLKVDGNAIVADWSACEVDGFYAYKLVRSTDGKIGWPAGDNDTVVAVIEDAATTAFADTTAAKGKTYFYKVLAFASLDGVGYAACRTDIRSIDFGTPPAPATGGTFGLTVGLVEGKVLVDWTACGAAGFDYYKVVRSKDGNVTFPAGSNDAVIAAVGPDGDTKAWDKEAPGGMTLYYAVFCVDKTEAGYAVLAATSVKSIATPAATPKPTPRPTPVVDTMGFSAQSTAEGVVLSWEACGSDGFSYYKVVRSRGDNPSYFPGTEGSEVIAVIENSGTTTFVDNPPEGGTWFYRIQAIGHWDGQKVLLGQTPALSVAL